MSPLDLIAARNALQAQYVTGSDMRTFIKAQREIHLLLGENNAVMNMNDQFETLLNSVTASGHFVKVLDNFLLTHPTVLTRTFQSLAIALVEATDSLSTMTVHNHAYLANGETKKKIPPPSTATNAKPQLTGTQPSDPKERVVIITQYYCPKHKWCNVVHKSPACLEFVEG